jgi:hemoglobin
MITVYEAVGAMGFFERLVGAFYRRVTADPVLTAMYDADDLPGAQQRLTLFLAQYWGGPETYSDQRGHPRLRMRHIPFAIGPTERDHWLTAMTEALDEVGIHPLLRERFDQYFQMSAEAMRNRD